MTTKGFLGAIACPPSLLNVSRAKKEDLLHLIHFESDRLCSWKPGPQKIRDCCTSFTYVTNEIASYKGHFGPDEHDYSHWMGLNLPNGSITLYVSCSSFDLKLPRRPEGMPHSVLFHGSAANSTLSWNSLLSRQWSIFLLGRKLKGVKS